jgi:hypothetical protein
MLNNILKVEGSQVLSSNEQKTVVGGATRAQILRIRALEQALANARTQMERERYWKLLKKAHSIGNINV